ncbi:hypothetical protein [Kitasatospora sp. NPDC094011]|uniref:hypothetical protein n=1 Tax=Kitasatospora sp. NPDC094011 TaxID=3364090 RepID=UPI00382E9D3E
MGRVSDPAASVRVKPQPAERDPSSIGKIAWAFDAFAEDGLLRLDLLHEGDNDASCRVAEKSGYPFARILPAFPPYPLDGHLHSRKRLDTTERHP